MRCPPSASAVSSVVRKVDGKHLITDGCYEALYFLGMSTDSPQCSDWWARTEVSYADYAYLVDRLRG